MSNSEEASIANPPIEDPKDNAEIKQKRGRKPNPISEKIQDLMHSATQDVAEIQNLIEEVKTEKSDKENLSEEIKQL